MTNGKPSSSNQLYNFDCTYFSSLNAQPLVHSVLKETCKKFIYQLEKCPNTGSLHYQIYISTKSKYRDRELGAYLCGLGLSGITVRPASNNGKSALKGYCMKKESRQAGPWADKPIYLGADLIKVLRPWQKSIEDLLKQPPDSRSIQWYYDAIGCVGKSALAKYMYFHHKILTLTIGNASDILNLVYKLQGHKIYIFDISRTVRQGAMTEIYQALEAVKNGYFINTKYDTGVCCMAIPHVVVFSNHLPKMSALSLDRWKIHDMSQMSQDNYMHD